jgi:hypothetical protein
MLKASFLHGLYYVDFSGSFYSEDPAYDRSGLNSGDVVNFRLESNVSETYTYNSFAFDNSLPSLEIYRTEDSQTKFWNNITSPKFSGNYTGHTNVDDKFLVNTQGHGLELKINTSLNSGIGLNWEGNQGSYAIKSLEVHLDDDDVNWNSIVASSMNNINPFLEANVGTINSSSYIGTIKVIIDHNGASNELRFGINEFAISPVPEPSTYALILGAVALGFAFRRRK